MIKKKPAVQWHTVDAGSITGGSAGGRLVDLPGGPDAGPKRSLHGAAEDRGVLPGEVDPPVGLLKRVQMARYVAGGRP